MLDLALATRLVDALPSEARLVLLGDKDQLAAVEAGAVFAELSAQCVYSMPMRAHLAQLAGQAGEVHRNEQLRQAAGGGGRLQLVRQRGHAHVAGGGIDVDEIDIGAAVQRAVGRGHKGDGRGPRPQDQQRGAGPDDDRRAGYDQQV